MLLFKQTADLEKSNNAAACVYRLSVNNNFKANCFAIKNNIFITCAHNFINENNLDIIASNETESIKLSIIKIDFTKDLALLKSDIMVDYYVSMDTYNEYFDNYAMTYSYNKYNNNLSNTTYKSKSNYDYLLSTQKRNVYVKILYGYIEYGYSGAPVFMDEHLYGIISCVNNKNNEIYAISINEIIEFSEE